MSDIVTVKKSKKKSSFKNLGDTTTATLACAGIGGLGGFVFAYYNEKTYWISVLVGLVAGGLIGRLAIHKLTNSN
jgi:uncharacterized membrane protein YfcA